MWSHSELRDVDYYFITDEGMNISPAEQAEIAVQEGVKMIQYRRKSAGSKIMYEEASEVAQVCRDKAIFIINDRIDIALAVDADGVHLGQDDIPYTVARKLTGDKILGVSTHTLEQAEDAEGIADYIGVGPVHATDTKDDGWLELGIDGALEIAKSVDIPTAAIGGIGEEDVPLLGRDFDMICAVSSVTRKGNFVERVRLFEEVFKRSKRRRR